jgi:hypothetical protein
VTAAGRPPRRRPTPRRSTRGGRVGFDASTPFGRLATTHVLSTGGDALVALVLAGSLFFSLDPSGARWRIALYLLFTMAPFALVGPLIGPMMDRMAGGRRVLLIGSCVGRAVVAVLMISSAGSDSLLLFPEAFAMLVLAKSYTVAKAALVPTVVVGDHALVEANSKLQVLSGIAAFAAGLPGALLLWLFSPGAVAFVCAGVFVVASVASLRVPVTTVAAEPEDAAERAELRSAGVLSAASAMGTLRWIVGFVTFLLAFALRGASTEPRLGATTGRAIAVPGAPVDAAELAPAGAPPVWHFGVIVALTGIGGLVGAGIAPMVRRRVEEEYLLLAAVVLAALGGLCGLLFAGLPGQALLAALVAVAAASGKQAFDAVVQRDAPDANRGRSFARFESRFQVIWVLGAALPVVIAMGTRLGGAIVAALAAAAAVLFWSADRSVRRGEAPRRLPDARTVGREVRDRTRRIRRPDPGSPEPRS